MARFAMLALILSTGFAFAAPVPKAKPKVELPGDWKRIEVTVGGVIEKQPEPSNVVIKNDKIVLTYSTLDYKLDPDNESHIEITHTLKTGRFLTFRGIYILDGDSLIIAFPVNPAMDRTEVAKSGPDVVFIKLERIPTKEKK